METYKITLTLNDDLYSFLCSLAEEEGTTPSIFLYEQIKRAYKAMIE